MAATIIGLNGTTAASSVNPFPIVQYRTDGSAVETALLGEYYLAFTQRFTAALGSNAALFSFRNGATRTIKMLDMVLSMSFDGTAAASTYQLVFHKFTAASTTPTGGTGLGGAQAALLGTPAFAVVPESTGAATTTVADARYCAAGTALTTTGIVTTSPFQAMNCPRGATGTRTFFGFDKDIELAPNEGIVLAYGGTAGVIGDAVSLSLYWGEK